MILHRRYAKRMLWIFWAWVLSAAWPAISPAINIDWKHDLKITQKTTLVPDKFLRRFDPVTIFFSDRRGPQKGGPEHHPEKYVTCSPGHPGAFEWLDGYTLQFRPAEAWPPLSRFTWQVKGQAPIDLMTLMPPPLRTIPAKGQKDLDPIETLTLYFADPIPPQALAEMVTIALKPLPGVEKETVRVLNKAHFVIKPLERASRTEEAGYVLTFLEPIADNTHVDLKIKLALDPSSPDTLQAISYETAPPFRIIHMGSTERLFPVTENGVRYTKEQSLACSPRNPKVEIHFSTPPVDLGPIQARNLARFSPAVDDLTYRVTGKVLSITGKFIPNKLYRMELRPADIKDAKGRSLQMKGPSVLYFYLPSQPEYIRWKAAHGIIERFGPQMIPLEGRSINRLDVRIYPIDPLNRSLWPFPEQPLVVNEEETPFAPGEEPLPYQDPTHHIYPHELQKQLKALGSPVVSTLTGIPLRKEGHAATFGFDVKSLLEQISGPGNPGTYLVGMRNLDGSPERYYVRVQVTDLCLTTIDEAQNIQFIVTSLKTGQPVSSAQIIIEGLHSHDGQRQWTEMVRGKTDGKGYFTWPAEDRNNWKNRYEVKRIVVISGPDVLVLDPLSPPDQYQNNVWQTSRDVWCQWALEQKERYAFDAVDKMVHIFTERPVYKPDEPVHIKGFLRNYNKGELSITRSQGHLVVKGPGRLQWRYAVTPNSYGSFYHTFQEPKVPTGHYTVFYEDQTSGITLKATSFKIEAYRLPKFEVNLYGPDTTHLDEPFTVGLTAKYYAGGRVAKQPLRWRVTQFPYTWTPKKREGFYYSTDARFSRIRHFRATPAIEKTEMTDDEGAASFVIDPTREPTAQPRRYVIEATITGADDQTVSNTYSVLALPPFTLGLKIPRYIKNAQRLEPEIIVAGPKGELLAGQELQVRVLLRQWHSHLQASDFSQGSAKYVTEVVDEPIFTKRLVSRSEPLSLKIPIERAGVYIVEVDAQDQVGRSQSIRVDLFAGGEEPVTWQHPPTRVFKVTPEKNNYKPGENATLVLESPFQKARVLAIVERPEGKNQYQWLNVKNGSAAFNFNIEKQFLPRIPVHFILMRGRTETDAPLALTALDLGKPQTIAATCWVEVTPAKNRIKVELKHPKKAQPGEEINVNIQLSDDEGKPLSGEVTLWLVDQAVLALGTEQPLDPLPDFIMSRDSHFIARDTRNLIFGHLPLQEIPGGGMARKMALGAMSEEALLDRVTIRKNFKPVPYYNPGIIVDRSGKAVVKIKLPDNLTNFKLRAKAVSGSDRFGYGTGRLAVRLPLMVQPSLPRFVRPGDQFTAIAIGRIVDGEGGAGQAQIQVEGVTLDTPAVKEITWTKNTPERIEYPVRVSTPEYQSDGTLNRDSVTLTLAVERRQDQAKDAFSITLPIQPDQRMVRKRLDTSLTAHTALNLASVEEAYRPGTLKRSLLITRYPAIVHMAEGLDYLRRYPHGCTEQRISEYRAYLAAKRFRDLLVQTDTHDRLERSIKQTLEWITTIVDKRHLAAYWPGSEGNVSLTAWVVQFMLEARDAGFQIDEQLLDNFINALKQSLRSDYGHYVDGESYAERCWALTALADADELDVGYATELARRSEYLNLESVAQVTRALQHSEGTNDALIHDLRKKLWDGIILRLYQGHDVYGGLQGPIQSSPLILPSETRTLAEVLRTVATSGQNRTRQQLLVDALVTLGKNDGWGSTNANSAALLALTDYMTPANSDQDAIQIMLKAGADTRSIVLDKASALKREILTATDPVSLSVASDIEKPLLLSVETAYLPLAAGSEVAAHAQGFVVQREMLKIETGEAPPVRIKLDPPGHRITFRVSDIVEDHLELVNPQDRHYVAVVIPMAAGMEPLNPSLTTAPPEAVPDGKLTLAPTYVSFMDDAMAYYYNTLPKGTYHFYFRTRATIPGVYVQPSAYAEMMYDQTVNGHANGVWIVIQKTPGE